MLPRPFLLLSCLLLAASAYSHRAQTRPAAAIAQATKAFGQGDDITALTLQRRAPA